jgi:hypothetical protein
MEELAPQTKPSVSGGKQVK